MPDCNSLDALVRARLKKWPQRPPGWRAGPFGPDHWLRARPAGAGAAEQQPYLKLPGSDRLRTLPDGLWLNFGGTMEEPFVDIFAIEACGSISNLLDKRSRFGASTHSLLAACPVPWLLAPVTADETPRWKLTGVISQEPALPLVLPIRALRVMYGLKPTDYFSFARHHVAQAHEFFVPIEALITAGGRPGPAGTDRARVHRWQLHVRPDGRAEPPRTSRYRAAGAMRQPRDPVRGALRGRGPGDQ
jgi:hypothetical protein